MKHLTLFLTAVIISVSAYAESVAKIIKPYRDMPGAQYVNVLKSPDYKSEVEKMSSEEQAIHKKIKRFDTIVLEQPTDINSLADKLVNDGKLECIYKMEPKPESENKNLLRQMFDAAISPVNDMVGYAKKDGKNYTEFVYIIKMYKQITTIVYVKGKLTEDELQYVMPEYTEDIKITLGPNE